MALFGGNYFVLLLIAFSVVLVVPYLLSKIIVAWRRTDGSRGGCKGPDLHTLVRNEIQRLGGRTHRGTTSTFTGTFPNEYDKVIRIYQAKIKALQQTGQDENNDELKDLEESILFFKAAQEKDSSHFKKISEDLDQITKSRIALREIVNATRICLAEKIFILSEEQRKVMNKRDITNLIMTRTALNAFIQDALLESSTVCKSIERGRNKTPEQVYLAIRLIVLLKLGAAKKALYQMAIRNPKAIRTKFKKLGTGQLNSATLSLLRIGGGQYLVPDQVGKLIYRELCEFEQFKREFIAQQSREQEQKRRKQHSSDKRDPYKTYYEILGCQRSDSIATIKKCYHKLAMKGHPDRVSGPSRNLAKKAHEEFIKIQQAYNEIIKSRGH